MTSSPFFKFKAANATSKAAVPLDSATPYFLLTYLENLSSNFFTNGPSVPIHPEFTHSLRYFFSLPINNGVFTGTLILVILRNVYFIFKGIFKPFFILGFFIRTLFNLYDFRLFKDFKPMPTKS